MFFVMLHKVVLTLESVEKIIKCDKSNESYWAILSWFFLQMNLNMKTKIKATKPDFWMVVKNSWDVTLRIQLKPYTINELFGL